MRLSSPLQTLRSDRVAGETQAQYRMTCFRALSRGGPSVGTGRSFEDAANPAETVVGWPARNTGRPDQKSLKLKAKRRPKTVNLRRDLGQGHIISASIAK